MKIGPLVVLLLSLVLSAYAQAQSHFQSRPQAIQNLQEWRQTTLQQNNIDELEKDLRLSFITRLIFQVERHYQTENALGLRSFMIQTLKKMERIDQRSDNQSFGSDEFFISQLRQALEEILEPTEDVILFMSSYLNFSGLTDPSSVDDFGSNRSYINGDVLVSAQALELEEASLFLTEKLKEFEQSMVSNIKLREDLDLSSEYQDVIPKDLMLENSLNP